MKLNKIFSALMLIAAVAFTACETPEPPVGPQGPGNGQDTTQNGDTTQVVDVEEYRIKYYESENPNHNQPMTLLY